MSPEDEVLQPRRLTNEQVILKSMQMAVSERKHYLLVLELLNEVEKRKIYLERGFSNLFLFCTKFLNYSEGAAQRRIESMRLLKSLPQKEKLRVSKKVSEGKLQLTHLSRASQVLRHKRKKDPKWDPAPFIESMEGKTSLETDRLVAAEGLKKLVKREQARPVSADEYRISINLKQSDIDNLNRFIELTAHQNPFGSRALGVSLAIRMALQQVEKKKGLAKSTEKSAGSREMKSAAEAVVKSAKDTKNLSQSRGWHIPAAIRREVWARDKGVCVYQNPITKEHCGVRFKLELDHIQEFAKGGEHAAENLRLYCANHNRGRHWIEGQNQERQRKEFRQRRLTAP